MNSTLPKAIVKLRCYFLKTSGDSDADCTFRKSVGTQCISVSLMDFWSLQQTIPVSYCAKQNKKKIPFFNSCIFKKIVMTFQFSLSLKKPLWSLKAFNYDSIASETMHTEDVQLSVGFGFWLILASWYYISNVNMHTTVQEKWSVEFVVFFNVL